MRSGGVVHHKLPPNTAISTRQPENVRTDDEEQESRTSERLSLLHLRQQLERIARLADNAAHPVDEYNTASGVAGTTSVVTVQPTYDFWPEKIESIIITGPTGVITLQLGDRVWSLTIPASGILVIAPVALLLDRTDDRILRSATAGAFTLELMGRADKRFGI